MKKEKVLIIFILFIIGLLLMTSISNAFGIGDLTGDISDSNTKEVQDIGNKAIHVISVIGSIISVVVIIVLGIKYMLGSVEEKAQYKKTLIPYLIGAAFIFAASSIAQIIYNVAIQIK